MAMPAERVLQQIALEDIGSFVSWVVHEREKVFGKRFNISGDEFSGERAAQILSGVLGKGYTANMSVMRSFNFLSFEQWAKKQDWSSALNG